MTFTVDNASNAKSAIKIIADEYRLLKGTAENPGDETSASNNGKSADEIEVVAKDEGPEEDALKLIDVAIDDEKDVAVNDEFSDIDLESLC